MTPTWLALLSSISLKICCSDSCHDLWLERSWGQLVSVFPIPSAHPLPQMIDPPSKKIDQHGCLQQKIAWPAFFWRQVPLPDQTKAGPLSDFQHAIRQSPLARCQIEKKNLWRQGDYSISSIKNPCKVEHKPKTPRTILDSLPGSLGPCLFRGEDIYVMSMNVTKLMPTFHPTPQRLHLCDSLVHLLPAEVTGTGEHIFFRGVFGGGKKRKN